MNSPDMKQCENQILLFFRYLDEQQYEALVALLAPDAVWHRQGKVLQGPSQVHAALMQRSLTMKIAHIITNLVFVKSDKDGEGDGYGIDARNSDKRNIDKRDINERNIGERDINEGHTLECTIRGYMLVVRHEPGAPLDGPAPLKGIESIRSIQVRMRQMGGQWMIIEMSAEDNRFAANT